MNSLNCDTVHMIDSLSWEAGGERGLGFKMIFALLGSNSIGTLRLVIKPTTGNILPYHWHH